MVLTNRSTFDEYRGSMGWLYFPVEKSLTTLSSSKMDRLYPSLNDGAFNQNVSGSLKMVCVDFGLNGIEEKELMLGGLQVEVKELEGF